MTLLESNIMKIFKFLEKMEEYPPPLNTLKRSMCIVDHNSIKRNCEFLEIIRLKNYNFIRIAVNGNEAFNKIKQN